MSQQVIAMDIGGTTLKGARFDRDGRMLHTTQVSTPRGADNILAAVCDLGATLMSAAGGSDSVVGAGVGVPGIVDAASGTVRYAANLGWRDVPLRRALEARIGIPVAVDHDVAAAALAESRMTEGDLVFLSLGTGIACAHVVGGAVWRGASGAAGEIGHTSVDSAGERCACGQRGCLELFASAGAIERRYLAATGHTATAAQVAAGLDTDPVAASIWQLATQMIGQALANDVLVFDPALVVLGGGLAASGELLAEPVRKALAERLVWRSAPPVRTASHGTDTGRRGAAELAWRAIDESQPTQEGVAR